MENNKKKVLYSYTKEDEPIITVYDSKFSKVFIICTVVGLYTIAKKAVSLLSFNKNKKGD
jgi:hypothetical protein